MATNDAAAKRAGWLALLGLVLYVAGIGTAITFYGQRHPQAYSPLNHFVSELSSPTLSPMAWVMNASISLGSLLLIPLVLALGRHVESHLGRAATVMGVIAVVCVTLLGTSPMEHLTPHLIFAMGFFAFCMIEVAMFTTAFWMKHSFGRAPLLLATGVVASVLTACFLGLLSYAALFLRPKHFNLQKAVDDLMRHPDAHPRPAIWTVAILEWSVVLAIFAWIAASAFYLLGKGSRKTVAE